MVDKYFFKLFVKKKLSREKKIMTEKQTSYVAVFSINMNGKFLLDHPGIGSISNLTKFWPIIGIAAISVQ